MKVHIPGHPGRLIVSSSGVLTENISLLIDFFLKPCVAQSYTWDTTDFLNKLWELPPLPPNSLLVTLDVSSLYSNIPHHEGITACEEALNLRELLMPPTANFCHLTKLILSTNSFTFNKEHYLQVHGMAMGTCMASSYATYSSENLNYSSCKPRTRYLLCGGGTLIMFSPCGPMVSLLFSCLWIFWIYTIQLLNLLPPSRPRKSLFWTHGSTLKTAFLRPTCMWNQWIPTSISIPTVAILKTIKMPSPMDKLSALGESVLSMITSSSGARNWRNIFWGEVMMSNN